MMMTIKTTMIGSKVVQQWRYMELEGIIMRSDSVKEDTKKFWSLLRRCVGSENAEKNNPFNGPLFRIT